MRTSPRGSLLPEALCAALAGAVLVAMPMSALADGARNAVRHSVITQKRAAAIAKRVYPGRILFKGVKSGHDGKGSRYSFAIVHHGTVHEVVVDGRTGAILKDYRVPKYPRRRSQEHPKGIPHTIV